MVLVKDMAQLIVERATLINHLLPQDEQRTELAEHVLTAMIDMFYMYLIKAQLPQIEAAFQWVSSLLWRPHTGSRAIMLPNLFAFLLIFILKNRFVPFPGWRL